MQQNREAEPKKRQNPTSGQTGRAVKSKTYESKSIGFSETRQASYGQWVRIHGALGVIISTTFRQHRACPGCGGKDRFRVQKDYENTGAWICGGGGDLQMGDGFALLGHVFGWSPAEQLAAVKRVLGLDDRMTPTQRRTLQQQAEAYQKAMAARVAAKEERYRLDNNAKDCFIRLEDMIDYREYNGRLVSRALAPTPEERSLAQQTLTALSESYGLGSAI